MSMLSEDPTYLAGALILLAGSLVVALKVTQQGKYLVGAIAAFSLALLVFLVEWMWVTDGERIESVVSDVRTAVLKSDVEGVLSHLTPDVIYSATETSWRPEATKTLIRTYVNSLDIEFARISDLKISVGQHTRLGTAEFRVFSKGGFKAASRAGEGRATMTAWSMGFRETEPGVWKIYRISPIGMPDGIRGLIGGSRRGRSLRGPRAESARLAGRINLVAASAAVHASSPVTTLP